MDITLRFTSTLDLLVEVQNVLGTDLVVNEDKTVSFITRGSDRGARIRYAKNIKGIEKMEDSRGVANKIYGFGGGNPPAEIGQNTVLGTQGAEHVITAISGATITAHSRLVSSNDEWNGFYFNLTRAGDQDEVGSQISIIDSISPNQIVLSPNIINITVGDYFRIDEDISSTPIKYVKDKDSIDTLGEIKKAVIYNDIIIATNLLLSTDFSGIYVAGKDDRWTTFPNVTSAISFSQNTLQTRIINGTNSQHCFSAATGAGISQSVRLSDIASNYSLAVWIYIISGTVELVFFDATNEEPFNSTGKRAESSTTGVWIQLLIEGLTNSGVSGSVRIKSRATNSEWFLDSIILERAAKISSPTDFYKISGARRIWDRTFDTLQRIKNISNKYTVNLVDLHEVDPDSYPYDLIVTGDTVTVQDDDISIDVNVRVKSKSWNVFEPQEATLEIDNFSNRLSRRSRDSKKLQQNNLLQLTQTLGLIKNARTLASVATLVSIQKITRLE